MVGPFFGRLFVYKQTYLSQKMLKLRECIFCCFVNKIQKGNFIMPIVVFTVALVLGISSPEYQDLENTLMVMVHIQSLLLIPVKRVYETQDMRLLQENLSCSNRSRLIIKMQGLSVVNKMNCTQLAKAAQDDVSLRRAEPSTRSLSALRRIKPCAS